jgi:hypothetical protein
MASLPAIQEEYEIGKLYNITVNDEGRLPKIHKNMILQKIEEDEDKIYYEFILRGGGGGMAVLQDQIDTGYIQIKEAKENVYTAKPSLEFMNLIKNHNRNLYTQTAVAPADRTLNTFGRAHPSVQENMVYGNAVFAYGFKPTKGGKRRRTKKRKTTKRRKSRSRR